MTILDKLPKNYLSRSCSGSLTLPAARNSALSTVTMEIRCCLKRHNSWLLTLPERYPIHLFTEVHAAWARDLNVLETWEWECCKLDYNEPRWIGYCCTSSCSVSEGRNEIWQEKSDLQLGFMSAGICCMLAADFCCLLKLQHQKFEIKLSRN